MQVSAEQRLPKTRAELVYELIKDKILKGQYEPMQRLVADQLTRELNTSVIPIREALHRLESEGLVEMQPYVGARVAAISESSVEEHLVIRMALEPPLARSATAGVTPEALQDLERLCQEMDAAISDGDLSEYGRRNYQFHERIYQLSPWRAMYQLVNSIREKFSRSRWVFHLSPTQSLESQEEHWAMVEALRQRDGEALFRLSRQQKERALQLYRKVMQQRVRDWI